MQPVKEPVLVHPPEEPPVPTGNPAEARFIGDRREGETEEECQARLYREHVARARG